MVPVIRQGEQLGLRRAMAPGKGAAVSDPENRIEGHLARDELIAWQAARSLPGKSMSHS